MFCEQCFHNLSQLPGHVSSKKKKWMSGLNSEADFVLSCLLLIIYSLLTIIGKGDGRFLEKV